MSKPKVRATNLPLEIGLQGPALSKMTPESISLVTFSQLTFEQGTYYNSVPLTTEELKQVREKITEWLGDEMDYLAQIALANGFDLIRDDGE